MLQQQQNFGSCEADGFLGQLDKLEYGLGVNETDINRTVKTTKTIKKLSYRRVLENDLMLV